MRFDELFCPHKNSDLNTWRNETECETREQTPEIFGMIDKGLDVFAPRTAAPAPNTESERQEIELELPSSPTLMSNQVGPPDDDSLNDEDTLQGGTDSGHDRPTANEGARTARPLNETNQLRRSTRIKAKPDRFLNMQEEEHLNRRRHQANILSEPTNYSEAMRSPESKQWKEAMEQEYQSIMVNKTWTLTTIPPGRNAIKSKWVFKAKLKEDGTIERFKARLVAQGFSQRYGIDYDETFSPVASKTTIRILIGLRAQGWVVQQIDVDTAYLNANIDADLYITQPQGFEVPNQGELRACKLNRAIYGLKQAVLAWYNHHHH